MKFLKVCTCTVTLLLSSSAFATGLSDAKAIQNQTHQHLSDSQTVIDKSYASSQALKADIAILQKEFENLRVYRNHLSSMVDNQQKEAASLEAQIEQIQDTRQGVIPLMYQMLDGLNQIVEEDIPLRQNARLERVASLTSMMSESNVSDAEKYRRILEAYQIELDYGTKLGVYRDQISISDTQRIEAELLYLGRISFIARNRSGSEYWSWNRSTNRWQALDTSNNARFDEAYRVANNQSPPSLLSLPFTFDTTGLKNVALKPSSAIYSSTTYSSGTHSPADKPQADEVAQ
ncbi:DUF3450 domain-containing protein [Vibrio genomosp. F10]|uniref:DUF3450 domain-containing protein n=1 Tax=Vibrio genomosp. F10 TaxID=723171 RepID=UPI000369FB89|nr:DUF3450 domain-containing protein [Vibrio genomosp. F10]OEF05115.1 hypothetical protein A1QI_08655 [Vibrio genomosp. F10 str. 9ZB36]